MPAVRQFASYREISRNLITPGNRITPVRVVEMSASGFRIARVPPFAGRYFTDEDERTGAPSVVVIGFDLWQSRFGGDPKAIGQTLQLGGTTHTIIGVMPSGFAFPIQYEVWTPLRLDPAAFPRGNAPPINVFGRLASSATLSEARAQADTISRRLAADFPDTHAHIRIQVIRCSL